MRGVEPGAAAAEEARGSGLNVHHGVLDSLDYERESFDLVAAWMVLEHVPDPRTTLTQMHGGARSRRTFAAQHPQRGQLGSPPVQIALVRPRPATSSASFFAALDTATADGERLRTHRSDPPEESFQRAWKPRNLAAAPSATEPFRTLAAGHSGFPAIVAATAARSRRAFVGVFSSGRTDDNLRDPRGINES